MIEMTGKVLNRDILIGLIGNDPEMAREFEQEFLQQANSSLVKLVGFYNKSQMPQIKDEAHYLKTSAKAVGAEQTAALLQELEVVATNADKAKCKQLIKLVNDAVTRVKGEVLNEK